MRIMIYLGLTLLLSSCAGSVSNMTTDHYTQTVQSWRGGQASALVNRWGRPDIKMAGRDGTTTYTYKTTSYGNNTMQTSPAVGVNVSRTGRPIIVTQPDTSSAGTRSQSLTCYTTFVANAQGEIVGTHTQGQGCYGGQGFVKSRGNPDVER